MSDEIKDSRAASDATKELLKQMEERNPQDRNMKIIAMVLRGMFEYNQSILEKTDEILNRLKDSQKV